MFLKALFNLVSIIFIQKNIYKTLTKLIKYVKQNNYTCWLEIISVFATCVCIFRFSALAILFLLVIVKSLSLVQIIISRRINLTALQTCLLTLSTVPI